MNKNKSLPIIVGAAVIVIAVIIVFAQNSKKEQAPVVQNTEQTSTPSETIKPTTTTTKPTTTVPNSYTLAVVATHNTPANCWTAINGNVYDVTTWISKHPGGKKAIEGTCGKDASAYFNGQHGGQPQPVSTLATFKIGTLSK